MQRSTVAFVMVSVAACGGSRGPTSAPAAKPQEVKAAVAPPPVPEPAAHGDATKPEPEPDSAERAPATSAREQAIEKVTRAAMPTAFETVAPKGATAGEALTGSVLVWVDATFYLAPKDDAATLRLATLERRTDHVGEAVPMRVVNANAGKGGFIEVESPVTDDLRNDVTDCAWFGMQTQLDMGRWRMFVKRGDLAPVVTKRLDRTFPDGSRVRIEPGAAVVPLADGRMLVGLNHVWVPLAADIVSIGHAYPTPPPPRTPKPIVAGQPDPDEPAYDPKYVLKAREVAVAGASHVPLRGVFAPTAEKVDRKDDVTAFPIADVCGSATVIARTGDVQPYVNDRGPGSAGGAGFGIGSIMGAERWYLPKGTRLVAEHGTASATTFIELELPKPVPTDKQVCIDRYPFAASTYLFGPTLKSVDKNSVRLCVSATVVKHVKADGQFGRGFGLKRPAPKK